MLKRYNLHVDPVQLARIEAVAERRGMKPSMIIRLAMTAYADAWEKRLAAEDAAKVRPDTAQTAIAVA